MGLKFASSIGEIRGYDVLIEPLWDWNAVIGGDISQLKNCINRTIVGLKYFFFCVFYTFNICINRTIVGLK